MLFEAVPQAPNFDRFGPASTIPTPEEMARFLVRRLPRELASFLLTTFALASWITLPLNFVSQLAQIDLVINFYRDVLVRFQALGPILQSVATALAPLVEWWRALIAPVKTALMTLLPEIPAYVLEVSLTLTLALPALVQFIVSRSNVARGGKAVAETTMKVFQRLRDEGREHHGKGKRLLYDRLTHNREAHCYKPGKHWKTLSHCASGWFDEEYSRSLEGGKETLDLSDARELVREIRRQRRHLLVEQSSIWLLVLATVMTLCLLLLEGLTWAGA